MRYLIFTIIVIIIFVYYYKQRESFQWDPLFVGKTSVDCYAENNKDCLNYSNCGICIGRESQPKCMPGDENGPFFNEGCRKWAYTNYYDKNIFDEKTTNLMQPWDKWQPGYEVKFPSPITRSTLFL